MQTMLSAQPSSPFSNAAVSSQISIQSPGYSASLDRSKSISARPLSTHAMATMLMLPFALTFSVITSSVVVENPSQSLRNSGAVSVWGRIRRRGKRLSLGDARLLALRILAETETRIQNERQVEYASLFAADDIDT